ncbi:MAG: hypothetical protein F7C08_01210 [Desulfurococcales archaeon]|nr:hypothetical protein [Desulfurococcales archaeon]MCE4605137.1 hypothetical protein [Desulfurococcales archaeon]
MDNPIEGWIIRGLLGGVTIYWKVSGYMHPPGELVVTPYRIENRRVDPGHKPFGAGVRYMPCIGRPVNVERRGAGVEVDPSHILKLRLGDLKVARPHIVELLEILNPEWAGLTGSWAIFQESKHSDVDLLAYQGDGWDIYKALEDLKDEGLVTHCPGRYHANVKRIHGHQLLDACYKGQRYTLRILETIEARECTGYTVPHGWIHARITIEEPLAPHRVPALYRATIEGMGRVVLETWHTRYQEIAPAIYVARIHLFYTPNGVRASPDLGGWIKACTAP